MVFLGSQDAVTLFPRTAYLVGRTVDHFAWRCKHSTWWSPAQLAGVTMYLSAVCVCMSSRAQQGGGCTGSAGLARRTGPRPHSFLRGNASC